MIPVIFTILFGSLCVMLNVVEVGCWYSRRFEYLIFGGDFDSVTPGRKSNI